MYHFQLIEMWLTKKKSVIKVYNIRIVNNIHIKFAERIHIIHDYFNMKEQLITL